MYVPTLSNAEIELVREACRRVRAKMGDSISASEPTWWQSLPHIVNEEADPGPDRDALVRRLSHFSEEERLKVYKRAMWKDGL
jgi:hypothetical protein